MKKTDTLFEVGYLVDLSFDMVDSQPSSNWYCGQSV